MARLGMNIAGISDLTDGYSPFIRWDRHHRIEAGGFFGRLVVNGVSYAGTDLFDQGWYDANYELDTANFPALATAYLFEIFVNGQGTLYVPNLTGKQMKMTWTGGTAISSIQIAGDANNSPVVDLVGKTATFTFGATQTGAPQGGNYTGNSWVQFNFSGTGTPPRDIRIFEAANESRMLAGEIFDPTWLEEVKRWAFIRCMDMQHINASAATNYSDIATDNFSFWTAQLATTSGQKIGVPVSVLTALAVQSKRPIWICIPHRFTDAAVTSYVQALKDALPVGSPMVYIEYTNEMWNDGFLQTSYANTQGALISAWSADQASVKGWKWAGLRAAQVADICRTVFGTDSGTRWTGVLGTQLGRTEVLDAKLVGIDYHIANDAGAATTTAKMFSHFAGAPYFGPGPTTTASGVGVTLLQWANISVARNDNYSYFCDQLYQHIKSSTATDGDYLNISFWRTLWQSLMASAAARGTTMIMYEGGNGAQTILPLRDNISGETDGVVMNTAFSYFARSPQAAQLMSQMFDLYVADGGTMACKYLDINQASKYGPWGASQYLGDTSIVAQEHRLWNEGGTRKGALRFRMRG